MFFCHPSSSVTFPSFLFNLIYNFNVDSNGGTYVPSVLVKEGEKVSKPSDPSKENYIFNGWFLDSQDFDFNSLITGNLTLKASWIDNLPPEKYSFVFQSDYCSLNNETTYNNGQSVSLTLSLASKFEGCYVLPEDITVLIGDKLGEKGVDYTYDSSTGTLEMQVSANIVVSAMCKDSDNFYRVTEEGFGKAVKFENIDYVQREHVYIIYSSGIYLENIVTDYISPTVNHTIAKSMQTAISSPSYSTSETYQAIKGDKAYEYYSGDDFEEREIPKSDFRTSSYLNIEYLLNLGSVTYETIEDKFDEKLLSYVFQVTNKDGYKYNVIMSFERNMLKYLEYEYVDNQYVNEIGYTTYTFLKITPELPTL